MVGPVNDPTSIVPFELPAETHFIAWRNFAHSWREVDVVTDQQRVSGLESQDETLMLGTLEVIRQHALDDSATFDDYARPPFLVESLHGALEPGFGRMLSGSDPLVDEGKQQHGQRHPDRRGSSRHSSHMISLLREAPPDEPLELPAKRAISIDPPRCSRFSGSGYAW
jgi:hypothetical protein